MDNLLEKFTKYAAGFKDGDELCDRNIDLKVEHTRRVAAETGQLCAAENIPSRLSELALRAALLHDLSRFEQFRLSGSFNDAASFDHGDRSTVLAARDGWVSDLEHSNAEAVLTAVCWHNKITIPPEVSGDALTLTRILRDADKLDIMELLLRHLAHPDNPAVVFSLDSAAGVSPVIADAIAGQRQPSHRDMRTAADFTAAKLLWVYDLNFSWTHREFLRRKYIERLSGFLPVDPRLSAAVEQSLEFCLRRREAPEAGR